MKNEASHPLRFTFKKEERLSGKKLIDELFNNGSSFYLYPFKVYMNMKSGPTAVSVQVLMAISSKNFPRAVDRNRLKRMMREGYRINKNGLIARTRQWEKNLLIAFIYTGKKMESYELIHEKMIAILHRIAEANVSFEKNIK